MTIFLVSGSRFHWNIATATVSWGTGTTGVHARLAGAGVLFSASSATGAPLGCSHQYLAYPVDFSTGDRREHRNRDDLAGGLLRNDVRPMCKACEGILVMAWNRVVEAPADAVGVERADDCLPIGDPHDLEVVN